MHDNIDTATKPPKLFSRFKCANNGIGTDKAETNIAGNNTCFKYALTCSFTIRVISKRRTTNSDMEMKMYTTKTLSAGAPNFNTKYERGKFSIKTTDTKI